MRQFILHFGAHKTGTSAFQKFIQENRGSFYTSGLYIPELDSGQNGNYRGLAGSMAGEYDAFHARKSRLMKPLKPLCAADFDNDVLISSEHLSSPVFRPFLQGLANYIDSIGFKKVALLVVRDQISWLNSRIAQKRKMLHEDVLPFQAQVEKMILQDEGDWDLLCRQLQKIGFETHVIAYDEKFRRKGVVKSLFETPPLRKFGLQSEISILQDINRSFGAKQLILADLVRDYITDILGLQTHKVERESLRLIMSEISEGQLTDAPFNGFEPEFRVRVAAHYEAGNERLAGTYFDTEWSKLLPGETLPSLSPQIISDLSFDDQILLENLARQVIQRAEDQNILPPKV